MAEVDKDGFAPLTLSELANSEVCCERSPDNDLDGFAALTLSELANSEVCWERSPDNDKDGFAPLTLSELADSEVCERSSVREVSRRALRRRHAVIGSFAVVAIVALLAWHESPRARDIMGFDASNTISYARVPEDHSPVKQTIIRMQNSTDPRWMRGGFRYPRLDGRLQHQDEILIGSLPHKTWLTIDKEPVTEVRGKFGLKATSGTDSGKFCHVQTSDGSLLCDSGGSNAIFLYADIWGGSHVTFRSNGGTGMYLTDRPQGLVADSTVAGSWEAFKMVEAGPGKFKLKGTRAHKWCAEKLPAAEELRGTGISILHASSGKYCTPGASGYSCDAANIGTTTKVELADMWGGQAVSIKAGNDFEQLYCSDQEAGIVCNKVGPPSGWEAFHVESAGSGKVFLKGSRANQYCGLTPAKITTFNLLGSGIILTAGKRCQDSTARIKCDGGPPSTFTLQKMWNGYWVSIKGSTSGKYCTDRPEGVICDTSSGISSWQAFQIEDTGGGTFVLKGTRAGKYCRANGVGIICDADSAAAALKLKASGTFKQEHTIVCSGIKSSWKLIPSSSMDPKIVCDKDNEADAKIFAPDGWTARDLLAGNPDESKAVTFTVVRPNRDSSTISLKCNFNMKYVAVEADGKLSCSSSSWSSEKVNFTRHRHDDYHQEWTYLENGGKLVQVKPSTQGSWATITGSERNGWSILNIKLIAGNEVVRPLIRGVNLGNWFVLEKWMKHSLFHDDDGKAFDDECAARDELGLMKNLDPATKIARMEKHWSTWITKEDIKKIAEQGLNSVRVPVGFWMFHIEDPWIEGQVKYLDLLFEWCEEYNIAVLVDFHGLKGSQQGSITSGNCGACQSKVCEKRGMKTTIDFLDEENMKVNLKVIETITKRYSSSPVYLGLELANEVAGKLDYKKVMQFYQQAWELVKKIKKDALFIMFVTNRPSNYAFLTVTQPVTDDHIYFGNIWGKNTDTAATDHHLNFKRAVDRLTTNYVPWPVLIGEWSLDDHGQKLGDWTPNQHDSFFGTFGKLQIQAYEQHSMGWFYWNYKTAYRGSTWNWLDMAEKGWLPGKNLGRAKWYLASPLWWKLPACEYNYFTGGACKKG